MNTNWNDPNFQGFGGKNPFGGRPKKAKAPRKAVGTPLGRTALNLAVTLLVGAVYYYVELPALNLHSGTLYVFVILLCTAVWPFSPPAFRAPGPRAISAS